MSYVTIAERHYTKKGMEMGLEKGMEQGKIQGRAEGQASILLRQLERRFGPLPDAVTQCICAADSAQLEQWSLNILDAVSLDDVF